MNAKQICRVLVVLGCCMLLLGLAVQLPANASPVKQSISIPDLLLPWASNISASITSGPHSFGQGFQFSAKYAIGAGSGLDFANGTNFLVLSMASGTVIDIKSNLNGSFGNQVAVKHDVGGSVMIYGHLSEISPAISEGYHILRGQPLGRVGRSTPGHLETENMGAHLHIEFRDGGTCTFPVINGVNNCMSNPDFGNPIDWGSGIPVDGYRFYGYYDVDADLVETAGYNYDGSMVLGDWKTFFEFPYLDEGVRKKVFARVGVNFNCDKSSNTCENEAVDPNTSFATVTYDTSTTQYPAPGE